MPKQWFVADTVRNRQDEAALSVVALDLEAYIPAIERHRRIGHRTMPVDTPRFGTYIFVLFDRDADPWPDLLHQRPFRQYFRRILSTVDGIPVPVPDRAMEAIRAYSPPAVASLEPVIYQPGQRVTCMVGGLRKEAVFVEYCGNRPMVRTWIFGAERVTEVCTAELEPLELV